MTGKEKPRGTPRFFEGEGDEEEFVHEDTGGTVREGELAGGSDISVHDVKIGVEGSEPQEFMVFGPPGDDNAKEEAVESARRAIKGETDGVEVIKLPSEFTGPESLRILPDSGEPGPKE